MSLYLVADESILCYSIGHSTINDLIATEYPLLGVLVNKNVSGGHGPCNNPIYFTPDMQIREATAHDFKAFRVVPPPGI